MAEKGEETSKKEGYNSDIGEIPKPTKGDIAHTLARAGISAIPIIGGPAKELFSQIVAPPISKRRDKWIESIAEGLKDLEEKVDGFNIENLSQNDMFITTVTHATQIAIRNHQKEKLEALRNAVLNAALQTTLEEDIQLMFLNFIDTLTPWHLRIMKFFDEPWDVAKKLGVKHPNVAQTKLSSILELTYPELKEHREFYKLIIKDLFEKGLIDTEDLRMTLKSSQMFRPRTTDLGKQFIKFIVSPLQNHRDDI